MALKKRVADLTDAELEQELRERRARRGQVEPAEVTSDLQQALANLELPRSATLADVEAKYRALIERYSPERHASDPTRHRTAMELSDRLAKAYRTALDLLKG